MISVLGVVLVVAILAAACTQPPGSSPTTNGIKTQAGRDVYTGGLPSRMGDDPGFLALVAENRNSGAAERFHKARTLWTGWRYDRPQEAVGYLDQALAMEPGFRIALAERAQAHFNARQYTEALADINQAMALGPPPAEWFHRRGTILRRMGRYEQALVDYSAALQLEPGHARAYNNRGITHLLKEDYGRALADFGEALRIDPNYAMAHNNRGALHFHLERMDAALSDLERALALEPDLGRAHENRARVLDAMGQPGAGCRARQTACTLGRGQACRELRAAPCKG